MFLVALIIGLYSYLIFFLGILDLLYKNIIISLSIVYFSVVFIFILKSKAINIGFTKTKLSKYSKLFLFLIFIQAAVNLIGALGPELSFDALWYHLTIPKFFLENHKIFHIPGNLLYYSDLPKNIDLIYLFALSFSNEILAKIIHFSFGLLSILALFKLSRKFLNQEFSLLSCLIFYSNLVVGWQSTTSYVDLGRTFFEIVAIYKFLLWIDRKKLKYLIYSAIMVGFSLSVKISAFNSIGIFILLITLIYLNKKINFSKYIKSISKFIFYSLLVPLPYFLFSYFHTDNPIYPLFEKNFSLIYDSNPISILNLFLFASDPINPVYLIFLPLIILFFKRFEYKAKILIFYSVFSIILWFIISSGGGSRFILPYLPAFSILAVISISFIKNKVFKKYLLILILMISISSIGYRALANKKYIPVILNRETKSEFLTKNLNFSFGDFYDTDGYFKKNIRREDRVLLYGFHNLYYVDFAYIDSSWVKKGDKFNYIAVQNSTLPERFLDWKEIYYNSKTKVRLYSKEGKEWVY